VAERSELVTAFALRSSHFTQSAGWEDNVSVSAKQAKVGLGNERVGTALPLLNDAMKDDGLCFRGRAVQY
jgi:hypothetical protein